MSQYFSYDPATGQRGAGFPAPGADNPTGGFTDQWYGTDSGAWAPSDSPLDPHDEPYSGASSDGDDGDYGDDDYNAADAAVASNIVVTPGPFSRSKGL
jgi:hypothetical protein